MSAKGTNIGRSQKILSSPSNRTAELEVLSDSAIGAQLEPYQQPCLHHLNRLWFFTEVMRDPGVRLEVVRYGSSFDQTAQSLCLLEPLDRPAQKLVIFLHGMDGDCGDCLVARDLVKTQEARVVGLGGRGPAWVSQAFLWDAAQVISVQSRGFQGFYLAGVSMGGAQALCLAGLLPPALRRRLLGVMALIPGTDLPAIAARSSHERVRRTLRASVGGEQAMLASHSPHRLLGQYPPGLPFVILRNTNDSIMLSEMVESFVRDLAIDHPVTDYVAPGEHNCCYTQPELDYGQMLDALSAGGGSHLPPLKNEGKWRDDQKKASTVNHRACS